MYTAIQASLADVMQNTSIKRVEHIDVSAQEVAQLAPPTPVPQPTIAPTADGTLSVRVELGLTATAEFTVSDRETILNELRTQFSSKEIKHFDILIFTERRRTLLDLDITWRVSFEVVVAPDGNDDQIVSGDELVADVLSTVENPSFEISIKEIILTVTAVEVIEVELVSFECAMTDDGATMDPSQYLSLAHPVIAKAYGSAYACLLYTSPSPRD